MPELADYKVRIENYYGPLDLLLHLVKEAEVDVTRIALARVARQYIAFIEAMQKLDINLAGEFLALASQLLLIKSRTLVPPAAEEEAEEEEDPSLDLIRKLLEYKTYKDRGRALDHLAVERARRFGRPRIRLEGETEEEPLRNLELWDLVLLWSKAMKSTRLDVSMSILYHDVPLEIFMDQILAALSEKERTTFLSVVGDPRDRGRVVGTFLAMLQLSKDQRVRLEQDADRADILIERVS